MRFLKDYLDGDVYFKIDYPTQNLDRCRTQLKLVADMEAKWPEMQPILPKPPPSAAPNRQRRNDQHPRAAIHAAAGLFHIPQQAKSSPSRGAFSCFTRWR